MVQENEEWFYKLGGQEKGPYTTEEMNRLIQKGVLKRVTAVKRNDSEWKAAETCEELQFRKPGYSGVRPWVRYWARSFDVMVIGGLFGILVLLIPMDMYSGRYGNFLLGTTILIFSIPYEACLLKWWGTTPGKWILGIKIRDPEGMKLGFRRALHRSVLVWWRGQGAGLPFVSLIFNLRGYHHLKYDYGTTTWDRDAGSVVSHRPKSWYGSVLVCLIAALILYMRFDTLLP
jgi:hypothetical protein